MQSGLMFSALAAWEPPRIHLTNLCICCLLPLGPFPTAQSSPLSDSVSSSVFLTVVKKQKTTHRGVFTADPVLKTISILLPSHWKVFVFRFLFLCSARASASACSVALAFVTAFGGSNATSPSAFTSNWRSFNDGRDVP